jgi:hypothetical protein
MKNSIILSVLFLTVCLLACSQKNVPDNVKKEFAQKFSAAKSVKWGSEKANEFEAEFKMNGKEMSACFDGSGKLIETEAEVSLKDLPEPVANTLKKEFSAWKTDEISTVENAEMKGFEFALKNKKEEMTVIIGADGTILKKETAGEEKEVKEESDEISESKATEAGEEKEMKAPPAIVTAAFNQKYAGATGVEWGSEEANEWEAEFTLDGKKMSACFDSTAKWTTSETVISEKELPAPVVKALNTQFQGYGWNLIEIYESPEMKGFELGIKKGESAVEVIFDKDGKILKKSEIKKEIEESEKGEKAEKGENAEKVEKVKK